MELNPGYKQIEGGIIPKDWVELQLSDIAAIDAPICYGIVQVGPFKRNGVPVLAIKNLNSYHGDNLHLASAEIERAYVRSRVRAGDVLISVKGTTGRVGLVPNGFRGNISRDLARIRVRESIVSDFCYFALQSDLARLRLDTAVVGTTRMELSIAILRQVSIPFPSTLAEQRAIAKALSDVDAFIESLEQLIAKKRAVKQGAMQALLTGKTRLPGFEGEWEMKRIADIAIPYTELNSVGESLPVLTCSKHFGFMNSIGYFKNQVFSQDTSGYKVIRRGQIGYPANHIEEGSIGLQDLYERALVSPIYIVFSVNEDMNSFFLHRVLKLDAYRRRFKMATTSSVDRRGSLRWPAFSEIMVRVPSLPEQTAIAAVLSDMEAEMNVLEAKLAKACQVKQGMMQELLTGRIRLV